jgi:hypothetical protein
MLWAGEIILFGLAGLMFSALFASFVGHLIHAAEREVEDAIAAGQPLGLAELHKHENAGFCVVQP